MREPGAHGASPAGASLLEIRLRWRCESYASRTGARPWPTWIRVDVDGIGAIWRGFRPGKPYHHEGVEPRREYAIECTPMAILRSLPLRLHPVTPITVEGLAASAPQMGLSLPAPETTLLALLAALFDEFSFYGSPEVRDRELAERLSDDETPGEAEGITRKQLREELASTRRGSHRVQTPLRRMEA